MFDDIHDEAMLSSPSDTSLGKEIHIPGTSEREVSASAANIRQVLFEKFPQLGEYTESLKDVIFQNALKIHELEQFSKNLIKEKEIQAQNYQDELRYIRSQVPTNTKGITKWESIKSLKETVRGMLLS